MHHLPFLLPHDASYRGVKHLGLSAGGLVLDVGANDGISALSFRRLLPDNPVLSVEISPRHEPALRRLKARLKDFDYVLVGAGEVHHTLRLFTPAYKGILLHTFAGGDSRTVRHALVVAFGQAVADQCTLLEDDTVIQPLDELNVDPAFIKIDVEGMANSVLRGLRKTLERSNPAMMIEVEPNEINEMLRFLRGFEYQAMAYDTERDALTIFRSIDEFFISGNKNLYFVSNRSIVNNLSF
ncbi:FkbM family methyltransferase [Bradyrhizobium liaoningense]|nr:FkbM family methyltransferase [Bradyrhizobium japonicum USDA 135]